MAVAFCPTRPELIFPTGKLSLAFRKTIFMIESLDPSCRRKENNGVMDALVLSNDTDRDYCYYFVTTRTMSTVELQFIFSSTYQDGYFGLDNVELTSNRNLIINGNFNAIGGNQTMNSSNLMNSTNLMNSSSISPWILSKCASSCSAELNDPMSNLPQSFICSGIGISLRQLVNLNTIGRRAVYVLKFSLGFESSGTPGTLIILLNSS